MQAVGLEVAVAGLWIAELRICWVADLLICGIAGLLGC